MNLIERHTPQQIARRVALYIGITFAFSWTLWFLSYNINSIPESINTIAVLAGGFGPVVGSFVAVLIYSNKSLIQWLQDRFWSVPSLWWVASCFAIPVCIEAGRAMTMTALGSTLTPGQLLMYIRTNESALVVSLLFIIFINGGQEELGWRGYLQPVLQQPLQQDQASIVIGIIWGIWHLPFYVFSGPGAGRGGALAFGIFILSSIFISVLLGRMFNGSGSSLPIVMVTHGLINYVHGLNSNLVVQGTHSYQFSLAAFPGLLILITIFIIWDKYSIGNVGGGNSKKRVS
jgi:membrane protease YdiL (CAAX protease family)